MKIEEIAKMLGVSKSTVSLAINNKPGVSEATRKKVLETIRQMGYVPPKIVKSEFTNSNSIRLISCVNIVNGVPAHSNISSSFFTELIHTIESECKQNSYTLSFSSIDLEFFEEQILSLKESEPFSGVILVGTNLSASQIDFASHHFDNIVVIDTMFDFLDVDFIVMNNVMGGYKACAYLLALGHRNIGYIESAERFTNFELRRQGFLRAYGEHKLKLNKSCCYVAENDAHESKNTIKAAIKNGSLEIPDAFFCESDYIAIGVIKALAEKNIKVPEDVSVIGFDDVPEDIVITPEITTIRVEKDTIGSLAVKRLIHRIQQENEIPSIKQMIDTRLIERASCAPNQKNISQ